MAWELYRSPAKLLAALRKTAALLRRTGVRGLIIGIRRKIRQPTLPVERLVRPAEVQAPTFEIRQAWPGMGLSEQYSVAVIVPTRTEALVRGLLASMARSVSPAARVTLLVINNGQPLAESLQASWPVRLTRETRPFNWAAYNNSAAQGTDADFLLFLNDDIQALHTGWLDALLLAATTPGVGPVGAKLLYPDGSIQHCGVAVGAGGETTHVGRHALRDSVPSSTGPLTADAVTGACLMVTRSTFTDLHGFDEEFAFDYNDVDFCLRASSRGRKSVVQTHAELIHFETATRPLRTLESEQNLFRSRLRNGYYRLDN